jgi:hypothetical protein
MRGAAALFVVLLAATPARADVWADLAAGQRAVGQLDFARDDAEHRRATLEQQSQALAADIERVKGEAGGVRRDLKLQELLAAQKAKSDELERMAGDLRGRTSLLAGARRKLIADCDRALAAQLPESKRLELARLRTAQAAALAQPDRPIGVARAANDPLDGPRELQDKADLLRDSGDKLRREVQRLAQRIDGVERRRHLRERASAIDEDLFGESVSNRRSARVASTTFGTGRGGGTTAGDAANAPGTQAGGGSPAPGAPGTGSGGAGGPTTGGGGSGGAGGGGVTGGGSGAGGSGSGGALSGGEAAVLRNLVDPATLDELRRSDAGDDFDRQVRALRRAQGELQGMATELDRRARALSQRADELKHKK